eukprot:2154553-Pleurochrysis_carterae.AAC.1
MYHFTQKSNACEESTLRIEKKVSVPWRARLAEEKSAGFLPPCRAARTGSKRGGGVENATGGDAAGA